MFSQFIARKTLFFNPTRCGLPPPPPTLSSRSFAAIKYRHVLYLPIAVMQAGGAFGFFLACGTVIRCEELSEYKERGM